MPRNFDNLVEVGEIGVDAGFVMVGDPCYVTMDGDEGKNHPVQNWPRFCKNLREDVTQLNYRHGHAGLGVVVSSGYGDGMYPVYIQKNKEGRVAKLVVEFIPEDENGNIP